MNPLTKAAQSRDPRRRTSGPIVGPHSTATGRVPQRFAEPDLTAHNPRNN